MATRTVGDRNEEGKREESALEELRLALTASVSAQVRELVSRTMESLPASSARLDGSVRETLLEAGRLGLESGMEKDRSDCGAANAPRCGQCGGGMRYVGRERSSTETALGTVRLAMGRYGCVSCGASARPRAARPDIEASMTPTARRMASELGSACCCAEADRLLNVAGGVNFGAKRVERTTRLVGGDLEAWRTKRLSGLITVVGADGASNDASFDGVPVRKLLKEGRVLCVGLDGSGVPALPSETTGRKGKDGGRATTREAKAGVIWVVEPDGEGGMRLVENSTRHFAAIESAEDDARGDSPVARRMLRELAALGFAPEDVGVALGDGAEWLRRLYEEWFPNAVRIVDFFHAAEYLWAAARGRWRDDAAAAKRWAEKLCRLLKEGRVNDVLAALRKRGAGVDECAKALRYLSERRDWMRYGEYRSRGLPIGSGRVEAACKTVVGRRMKCTGMRWTVAGANPVLWVRCARLSGWFDDYWEHRLRRAA